MDSLCFNAGCWASGQGRFNSAGSKISTGSASYSKDDTGAERLELEFTKKGSHKASEVSKCSTV